MEFLADVKNILMNEFIFDFPSISEHQLIGGDLKIGRIFPSSVTTRKSVFAFQSDQI